jgi:hypothetical protein
MSIPYYRSSSPGEQQLYDHLIACRRVETPTQLLERFQCLFIDGLEYPQPEILETLYTLTASRSAEEEFKFILNRCCRILINFWWFQPAFRWAIAELVYLLQTAPRGAVNHSGHQRLRRLVYQFLQTEEYQSLQRLAYVVEEGEDFDSPEYVRNRRTYRFYQQNGTAEGTTRSLRNLIHRYPYLYPYCLGSHSSDHEFETIRHLQAERQRKFERDLSRYMTYLVQQENGASRLPGDEIRNPTLLSDSRLRRTVKHFVGPVEGTSTYRDLAHRFQVYSTQQQPYRVFKENLYGYLISSIDAAKPDYGKHHFNQWLYTQLKNTLPQSDTQSLNKFLVTRTCHQLVDSLIANPQQFSNHLTFIDLINNVGASLTVGLLLKLLLLCNNVRSNLEKRFASLYKHYEPVADGIDWLIESLESLQVAFSIHFGSVDFPCTSQL